MRYLDPKNDLTFKKIFGQHPHLLISFLNAVLPLEGNRQIESIEYLPVELVPEIPIFKDSMVDVRCFDKEGRQFIVEMQMLWTDAFMSRVLFNSSKAYIKQLDMGEKYSTLKPVYALSILNQDFSDSEYFYHHYSVYNPETQAKIEGLELIFVELDKFQRSNTVAKNRVYKALGILWLRFLKEMKELESEQVPEEFLQNPTLKEALEYLQESSFTPAQLNHYDNYWDFIRRESMISEGKYIEGIEFGLEKGEQIGLEKGLEQGKIEERDLRILKAIQKVKLSLEEIAELFEVSLEYVIELKNKI